ncbi:MAG: hypothetical protein AB8B50_01500 [Pirellulaceae bacterium]
MKKIIFCATVAIYCCGDSSLHAQSLTFGAAPTPAPKLVAAQSEPDAPLPYLSPSVGDARQTEIENPFDVLSPSDDSVSNNFNSPPQSQPAPIIEDPNSLPVGRRHRRHNAVVDTMAQHSRISNVPHASTAVVDWGYGVQNTPNPVATVLLHQQCVEGLWDSYSQQRAAECAKMWSRLTAKKRCHHCSLSGCSACKSGCASGGCDSCAGSAVVNRYQSQPAGGCDSCSQCATASPGEARAQLASARKQLQH